MLASRHAWARPGESWTERPPGRGSEHGGRTHDYSSGICQSSGISQPEKPGCHDRPHLARSLRHQAIAARRCPHDGPVGAPRRCPIIAPGPPGPLRRGGGVSRRAEPPGARTSGPVELAGTAQPQSAQPGPAPGATPVPGRRSPSRRALLARLAIRSAAASAASLALLGALAPAEAAVVAAVAN
jgi:hypothetical protein